MKNILYSPRSNAPNTRDNVFLVILSHWPSYDKTKKRVYFYNVWAETALQALKKSCPICRGNELCVFVSYSSLDGIFMFLLTIMVVIVGTHMALYIYISAPPTALELPRTLSSGEWKWDSYGRIYGIQFQVQLVLQCDRAYTGVRRWISINFEGEN